MRKIFFKSMLLLCALIVGGSSVWGAEVVTIWSENFSSYTTYDVAPTNTTFSYACTNGTKTSGSTNGGNTVLKNENTGGGEAPELMIGKKGSGTGALGGSFSVTIPDLKDAVSNYKLSYNSNNNKLTLSSSTDDVTFELDAVNTDTDNKIYVYNVTLPANTESFNITFTANTTSNVRVDNFELTGEKASSKTATNLAWSAASADVYTDDNSPSLPTLSTISPAAISSGITYSSTNTSVATINASGVVSIVNPGTTTINAIFTEDETYDGAQASYTLNVYGAFTGINELQTAALSAPYNTGSGFKAKITFADATTVTYVNGNYAFILDENDKGAMIYQSSHGFTAGKTISGTVTDATLCKYDNGFYVIKNVKSNTTGLSISDGSVTTQIKTIDAVSSTNQSMMVKFENVTYNSTLKTFTDGTNSIGYKDQFNVSPSLSNGGKYHVTGLLIMDGGALKVAPIAADGIVSTLVNPTSQWKNGDAALTSITINKAEGTKKFTFETNSNGTLTYSSTKTSVATIAADGTITPVGYGITTIKANTTSTSDYNADEKSFTLTVSDEGVDYLDNSGIGVSGTSYTDWNNKQFSTDAVYIGNTAGGNSAIQFRTDNSTSGIVTTTSGGKVCKITVAWNSSTTNGRSIDIYGKNTPYIAASDLYYAETQGTKLGSIAKGSTTLSIASGNYSYIGIRSNDKALYLDQIVIEWDEDVRCVETGTHKWATAVCDEILDFTSSSVKAYIVTGTSGSVLTMTAMTGTVPANTPLLIKANEGTYAIPVAASTTTNVDGNKLVAGTGTPVSASENKYVLAYQSDVLGFYKIASALSVPKGKAYLDLVGAASAPSALRIEDEVNDATNIEDVEANEKAVKFFVNGQMLIMREGIVYDALGRVVR